MDYQFGQGQPKQDALLETRTIARKSSVGRLYVCAGGLTLKFDKNSTDL